MAALSGLFDLLVVRAHFPPSCPLALADFFAAPVLSRGGYYLFAAARSDLGDFFFADRCELGFSGFRLGAGQDFGRAGVFLSFSTSRLMSALRTSV